MFSLIIPYHNRREWLPRTLQSVVLSSVRPACVFLVDNGSTDGSAQVCEEFAARHPDYPFVLLSEPRLGACRARNAALRRVQTEWVYFFDSDDELSPDYFRDVQRVITRNPNLDMVLCPTRMVFEDGSEKVRAVRYSGSVVHQILLGQLATQGIFVRTELLRRVGGWNEALPKWNDWELGVRLLWARPRLQWLSSPYHRIYQHPESLTGASFAGTLNRLLPALQTVFDLVRSNKIARNAFAARIAILAGQLKHQGSAAEAQTLLEWAKEKHLYSNHFITSPHLHFLYTYAALGGRGAWRIALVGCGEE